MHSGNLFAAFVALLRKRRETSASQSRSPAYSNSSTPRTCVNKGPHLINKDPHVRTDDNVLSTRNSFEISVISASCSWADRRSFTCTLHWSNSCRAWACREEPFFANCWSAISSTTIRPTMQVRVASWIFWWQYALHTCDHDPTSGRRKKKQSQETTLGKTHVENREVSVQ